MADELECTSERVMPEEYVRDAASRLIYLLHVATYRFAIAHAEGRRVLDFGCGTGYGTFFLAPRCARIVGVDVAADAIAYAGAHYRHDRLAFRRIDPVEVAPLPFGDGEFDTVLSFQVIEHLEDPAPYLREARRVLRRGGSFVLATPDRSTRLAPGQRPWNRFHVREYAAAELQDLLRAHFAGVAILGMSGDPALLAPELRRTRLASRAAMPFTFPGAPEWWRQGGLRLLQRLQGLRPARPGAGDAPGGGPAGADLDERQVWIREGAAPSITLVATAHAD